MGLTAIHALFLREHNRLADILKKQHPTWHDSVTFEEARRINIAQYQHIIYNELLPVLIGESKKYLIMLPNTKLQVDKKIQNLLI